DLMDEQSRSNDPPLPAQELPDNARPVVPAPFPIPTGTDVQSRSNDPPLPAPVVEDDQGTTIQNPANLFDDEESEDEETGISTPPPNQLALSSSPRRRATVEDDTEDEDNEHPLIQPQFCNRTRAFEDPEDANVITANDDPLSDGWSLPIISLKAWLSPIAIVYNAMAFH
ncbi:hypothetical protein H0H92_000918, partial [Tricholoma furcatifolium]